MSIAGVREFKSKHAEVTDLQRTEFELNSFSRFHSVVATDRRRRTRPLSSYRAHALGTLQVIKVMCIHGTE